MKKRIFIILSFVFFLVGCAEVAVWMTEGKTALESKTLEAIEAKRFFWQTLHHHRLKDIDKAQTLLLRAYLQNTSDPVLTAYLAFIHIWKLTERDFEHLNPLMINEIQLSQDYFSKALALDPKNPIYLGFLGDTYLITGQVLSDKKAQVKGYFMLKDAIQKWPEFNYFTAGYPMSTLDINSAHFKEALVWQWQTIDRCAGQKVDRRNPNFAAYMHLETTSGHKRACWNSWKSPHNFEGFFMNMGDMLVKSGDWHTAIIIYKNAKLSKTYATWPYRWLLERRILEAKENVQFFRETHHQPTRAIMFNSGYGCMSCHQKS